METASRFDVLKAFARSVATIENTKTNSTPTSNRNPVLRDAQHALLGLEDGCPKHALSLLDQHIDQTRQMLELLGPTADCQLVEALEDRLVVYNSIRQQCDGVTTSMDPNLFISDQDVDLEYK